MFYKFLFDFLSSDSRGRAMPLVWHYSGLEFKDFPTISPMSLHHEPRFHLKAKLKNRKIFTLQFWLSLHALKDLPFPLCYYIGNLKIKKNFCSHCTLLQWWLFPKIRTWRLHSIKTTSFEMGKGKKLSRIFERRKTRSRHWAQCTDGETSKASCAVILTSSLFSSTELPSSTSNYFFRLT